MNQRGFSLIEILIVIAIVGILVGVALPSYRQYTQRAHFTEITQATLPYKLAVSQCYQITLSLAECVSGKNGIPAAINNNNPKQLLLRVGVAANGVIVAIPKDRKGFTSDDEYRLVPSIEHHHVYWHTSGKAVELGYAK